MEDKSLKAQLRRVILWTTIIPLVLIVVASSFIIYSIMNQNEQNNEIIFDDLKEFIYAGFSQNELFTHQVLNRLVDNEIQNGSIETKADLDNAVIRADENGGGLMLTIKHTFFIAQDGEIKFVSDENNTTPSDLTKQIEGLIVPNASELFYHNPDIASLEEALLINDRVNIYAVDSDDAHFFLAWHTMEDASQLGIFTTSANTTTIINLMDDILKDQLEVSQKSIERILIYGVIALGILLIFLIFTTFYFAKKLSIRVSEPVEIQAKEQRELLLRTEEEKAMLEQVNTMKTEFLSNVSHELKTPLNVILSHMQMGKKNISTGAAIDEIERSMDLVSGETERMALMISQLLDIGRIDEGRMSIELKPESITEMIQTTMNTYYPVFSKNYNKLKFIPNPTMPIVLCDSMRIIQVLVNLIGNASRHTKYGTITISIEDDAEMVAVSVCDTGEGIAPELLPFVFERFNSSRKRAENDTGSGLGLFICKHIIEEHGGEITVKSEVGQGSCFTFTLPSGRGVC